MKDVFRNPREQVHSGDHANPRPILPRFLERQAVQKADFMEENDDMYEKMVIINAGDSTTLKEGQILTARKLRDENSALKRKDMKLAEARQATPATSRQLLMGFRLGGFHK